MPDYMPALMTLLRMQTVKPFIMLCDMGRLDQVRGIKIPGLEIDKYRAEDCEVYMIAGDWQHLAESIAAAMDVMQSACRTKYLFLTHTDCMPRRRDLLEWFMRRCNARYPVVGYELSPRLTEERRGGVGHTATMLHMPTMHEIGLTWTMRRSLYLGEPIDLSQDPCGWPDTETTMNRVLRAHGIKPLLVGHEENHLRTIDENIDHVRSGTLTPHYRIPVKKAVIEEAEERVKQWQRARGRAGSRKT
jgi:hypothetical protein